MWTIHDFPAYGLLSGCCTNGYIACPKYGLEFKGTYSRYLRKMKYLGYRHFLPMDHNMRRMKVSFNGSYEDKGSPIYASTCAIKKSCKDRELWETLIRKVIRVDQDPQLSTGWKHLSVFYKLPYWEVCKISLILNLSLFINIEFYFNS